MTTPPKESATASSWIRESHFTMGLPGRPVLTGKVHLGSEIWCESFFPRPDFLDVTGSLSSSGSQPDTVEVRRRGSFIHANGHRNSPHSRAVATVHSSACVWTQKVKSTPPGLPSTLSPCYKLNVCFPRNSHVEILTPNVMRLGGGAYRR